MKAFFPRLLLICSLWSASGVNVAAQSYTFTTIAGAAGLTGTADGTNGDARFHWPAGLALDGAGNVYVADLLNHTIRKLAPAGTNWIVSTLAGLAGTNGFTDGTNSEARFDHPSALAVGAGGNLFVTDNYNETVRKLTPVGTNWVVSTVAGLAGVKGFDDGTNSDARFNGPQAIAVDSGGRLYVTDRLNYTVRGIEPVGTNWVVSTLAGVGGLPYGGFVDGTNGDAEFNLPFGIARHAGGNLYVAEFGNNAIRKIAPIGPDWVTTTVAGFSGTTGTNDGPASLAKFNSPNGITVDTAENLYVADQYNSTIRKVAPSGNSWVVSTLGGVPLKAGSADGTGTNARFTRPFGIVVDQAGNLFVADSYNNTIRKGTPSSTGLFPPVITQQPTDSLVLAGSNVLFVVAATGTPPLSYQWGLNGNLLLGATNTALSLSNVSGLNAGFYTVAVSNSTASVTSTPALLDVRYVLAYGNGSLLAGSNYTFISSVALQLSSGFLNGSIFYTLDDSRPSFESSHYDGLFNLNRSATLRAIAYSADSLQAAELPPIFFTVIPAYALNLTSPGGGTVTASPPVGPYVSNTVVTLTPQPSNGWTFLEWRGDANGTSPTAAVTMNRAKTVQAIFGTTLGTTVAGSGVVNVYPSLPLYPYGTVARLTAIPQGGNYFAVWGNAAGGSTNPLYFTVNSATLTVSSLFAALGANQHALTVIPDGFGRVTITPRANVYATGANVSLNAIPDPGQQFLAWSGDAAGTQNPLTLSMDTSKAVTAAFTRKPSLAVAPPLDGLSEDGFRFTLKGEFWQAYRIDASTNLADWGPLTILTNAYGTVHFTDESATNSASRFYRASTPTP